MAEHGNGIALLFNRCDSKLFQDVIFEKASGILFMKHRIKFYRADGTIGKQPGCGSLLVSFGKDNDYTLKFSEIEGKFVEL